MPSLTIAWAKTGGSGGPVASSVIGLRGCLTDQGDSSIFNVIFEFDFFGNGDPVIDQSEGHRISFQGRRCGPWVPV